MQYVESCVPGAEPGPVRYNQDPPADWGALREAAQLVLDTRATPDGMPQTVENNLAGLLNELDGERLTDAYEYASGLGMCGIARRYQRAGYREAIALDAARRSVKGFFAPPRGTTPRPDNDPMRAADLTSAHLFTSAFATIIKAIGDLPPDERFLSDVLTNVMQRRRLARCCTDPVAQAELQTAFDDLSDMGDGFLAATKITQDAFTGARAIFASHFTLRLGLSASSDPALAEIIGAGLLDDGEVDDLLPAAFGLARIHLNEMNSATTRERLLRLGTTWRRAGKLIFDTSQLPETPPPLPPPRRHAIALPPVHQERKGCPARLVEALIPDTMFITAESWRQAYRLYQEKLAAGERRGFVPNPA